MSDRRALDLIHSLMPNETYTETGFTPNELRRDYGAWCDIVKAREPTLRTEVKDWLYDWNMWDLACSPMNDEHRRHIRYGHYLGRIERGPHV